MIEIDDHELHLAFILAIQLDRPARLALGVEAGLTIQDDVGGLSGNETCVHVLSGDERAVLTVAGVIELRIQFQVVSSEGKNRQHNRHNGKGAEFHHDLHLLEIRCAYREKVTPEVYTP